jgi:proline iminopeptidase
MVDRIAKGRHELTAGGARLVYHVQGDGPVVVAFPGGPGFSHTYLRAPLLERRARVVYLDPVGCGESDELADPSAYGRDRDIADLEAIREHLGLTRIALLGHSAGGFVAQHYAIAHPSRVSHLVLYGTSPTNGAEFDASLDAGMAARQGEPWFAAAVAAMDAIFARDLTREEAKELTKDIWPLYSFDGDPALTARLAEVTNLNPVRAKRAPHVPFDFRAELARVRVPTLIVIGARDFICSPALARMLEAAIAGSRIVTMDRSGHLGHLEEPETFAAVVASFLGDLHAD